MITNGSYDKGDGSLTISDAAKGKEADITYSPDPPPDQVLNVTVTMGDWAALAVKAQREKGAQAPGTYPVNHLDGAIAKGGSREPRRRPPSAMVGMAGESRVSRRRGGRWWRWRPVAGGGCPSAPIEPRPPSR